MSTVLIVDDTAAILEGLSRYLNASGFEARTAAGGAEALDVLEYARPDVLVLDLSMPEPDGLDVLEQIRDWPHLIGMPVIVYSAATDETTKRRAMRLGATEFVEKGDADWAGLTARVRANLLPAALHAPELAATADAVL